ncbi:uncharacterized protein znf106b isoform X2 [Paramisgurnus dabryanus]|uniref:uncharacterized protein znf106b isoform X2 n=1 Tax=Paramisgurnus dabryanus TaxID=90735 RepID=UPI0031F4292D
MDNIKKKKWMTKFDVLTKCWTCSQSFKEQILDRHMHSYIHHQAIERVAGSEQMHQCWACGVSVINLQQYKKHICTAGHRNNLTKLEQKRRRKEKLTVDYCNTEVHVKFKKNKTKKKKNKRILQKCFVCCHGFCPQDLDQHMHGLVHRQAIEKLKGSEHVHKCWACDTSVVGVKEYKKHSETPHHKYKMFLLNRKTDDEKRCIDYGVELDDELKALCAQRDQQIQLNKINRSKRRSEAKKALAMQKAQQAKSLQNCQTKNKSVRLPMPAMAESAYVSHPTPDGEVAAESTSHKQPGTSAEATCASHLVQRDDFHVSAMIREIRRSTDNRGVNVGSNVKMQMCAKEVVGQRSKSKHEELIKKAKKRTKKRTKKHIRVNDRCEPCYNDAAFMLGSNKPDQINRKRKAKFQQEQCMPKAKNNRREVSHASISSVSSLAVTIGRLHSQTSVTRNENVCPILEVCGNWQPDTDRVELHGKNTEQAETSLENLKSLPTIPDNLQEPTRTELDISNTTHRHPEIISTHYNVNKLMTLSSREEELSISLKNVGDQLFQAYSTLQNAYTEVQQLLMVKQQVTSEMASLRAKRIQFLQDMMDPS